MGYNAVERLHKGVYAIGDVVGTQQLKWLTIRPQVGNHVADALRLFDPQGVASRVPRMRKKRLENYITAGPDYLWCLDGYDKLAQYGIEIRARLFGPTSATAIAPNWVSSGTPSPTFEPYRGLDEVPPQPPLQGKGKGKLGKGTHKRSISAAISSTGREATEATEAATRKRARPRKPKTRN